MMLTVRGVVTHPVVVPLDRPIRTASGTLEEARLLLIDLHTREGVTGRAYLFSYAPMTLGPLDALVRGMAEVIDGAPVAPRELERTLRTRFALLGSRSLIGMAMSGLDMAACDALAVAAGVPLAALLGAAPRPIRAYLGNGIGVIPVDEVADATTKLAGEGFSAIKIRLGRPSLEDDVAAVRAARTVLPAGVALMADFNQSLTVAVAIRRGHALDGEGLLWIEEPVRAADFHGAAAIAAAIHTPIQIGENFSGPFEMHEALRVNACDFVMADAQQIGGVSGWLRAAALAQVYGVELSSHFFQELSAHLLAATSTPGWLEYMNVADPVLAEPLAVVGGAITASPKPGVGIAWNEAAVRRYRVA
jgi:mandelate racemase